MAKPKTKKSSKSQAKQKGKAKKKVAVKARGKSAKKAGAAKAKGGAKKKAAAKSGKGAAKKKKSATKKPVMKAKKAEARKPETARPQVQAPEGDGEQDLDAGWAQAADTIVEKNLAPTPPREESRGFGGSSGSFGAGRNGESGVAADDDEDELPSAVGGD